MFFNCTITGGTFSLIKIKKKTPFYLSVIKTLYSNKKYKKKHYKKILF